MNANQPFFPSWIEQMSSRGSLPAIKYKQNREWREVSWADYHVMVEEMATALIDLGLKPRDKIAIFASSRYEWTMIDTAALSQGIVVVPIYHTMTAEELQYILNDSGARMLFLENANLLKIFRECEKECPKIEKLFVFDTPKSAATGQLSAVALTDLRATGKAKRAELASEWQTRLQALQITDPATVIYTSGTTGKPKGVLLTHLQVASEVNEAFPFCGVTHHDVSLTFLPYSHIFGRIELWGSLAFGFTLAFAESIEKIRANLGEVKPTIMMAVPRIFEKIYLAIQSQIESNPLRKKMFSWALDIGRTIGQLKIARRPVPLRMIPSFEIADRLVLNKVRDAFGGRLRFAVSGGAPLNPEIAQFFHACGVLVLEGYGLTETTAAVCVNTPFDYVFGTVGKPIGDVQIKIADDGEILLKSDKIMSEYYNNPEATKEAFVDGWYKTGDIGEVLSSGQLKITDRKKDLIKTAGGKYVAPQKLEGMLKMNPLLSQVHIHGDQRKFIAALITLDPANLRQFAKDKAMAVVPELSDKEGLAKLSQHPSVQDTVRKVVAETNSQLAGYETIKRFAILPQDFSIETGELTPSLKIKRKFVDTKYKKELDALYS